MIRMLCNSSSKIVHHPMRKGEAQEKMVKLLPGPSAADLLGMAESYKELRAGLLEAIDYYKKLPTQEHEKVIEFYQMRRQSIRLAA